MYAYDYGLPSEQDNSPHDDVLCSNTGHQLTYGVNEDGEPVKIPLTNIVVTGGSGRGSTVTMVSLVADAIRQDWDIALATPKYMSAGGDFPGAKDSANIDMMLYRESNDFHEETLALAQWVGRVPTGTLQRPRLVILDSLQSMLSGDELVMSKFLGAVEHLLNDSQTAVVMRAQILTVEEFPELLRESVGAVISMGQNNSLTAQRVFDIMGGGFESDDLTALTDSNAEWPLGRGVLVTPGRTEVTYTPWVGSVDKPMVNSKVPFPEIPENKSRDPEPIGERHEWFAWHFAYTPSGRQFMKKVIRQRWERSEGRENESTNEVVWKRIPYWRYADINDTNSL